MGREKINQMCVQFGSGEIEAFFALKAAFDPWACSIPARRSRPWRAARNSAACTSMAGAAVCRHPPFLTPTRPSGWPCGRRGHAEGLKLRIVGGDTRAFYGRRVMAEPLAVGGHRGVVAYDPSELVITARGGNTAGRDRGTAGRQRPDVRLRALGVRAGQHDRRNRGGGSVGLSDGPSPARCATMSWAPRCWTGAARC